jgi:DMSO/TMAO reductase YedYZ molybdopterin-dependent catalytic subunit
VVRLRSLVLDDGAMRTVTTTPSDSSVITSAATPRHPTSVLRDERIAAALGISLGIAFAICFVTGLISHLVQDPGGWFVWPSRPAGLYRFTQGLHVTAGIASIPLVLAKLWVVYPKFFQWPPAQSVAHGVERIALLPLVGSSLLLVFTGLANINIYRPWEFSFRSGHYAAAWIAVGAMVIHVSAKWLTIRGAVRPTTSEAEPDRHEDRLARRSFLATVFATSGALALFTVGQTAFPLRRLALLAPRRPDVGPQGFPVNRTAASVGLERVDLQSWRLVIDGPGVRTALELSYDEILAMPQHEATLPIACVEGWSTTQRWRGVRVRDLLDAAGARGDAHALVHSITESSRSRTAPLNASHARDRDTLLAIAVNGERLHPDHGFPVRLIGPNRPGVHQTKWVGRIEVLS